MNNAADFTIAWIGMGLLSMMVVMLFANFIYHLRMSRHKLMQMVRDRPQETFSTRPGKFECRYDNFLYECQQNVMCPGLPEKSERTSSRDVIQIGSAPATFTSVPSQAAITDELEEHIFTPSSYGQSAYPGGAGTSNHNNVPPTYQPPPPQSRPQLQRSRSRENIASGMGVRNLAAENDNSELLEGPMITNLAKLNVRRNEEPQQRAKRSPVFNSRPSNAPLRPGPGQLVQHTPVEEAHVDIELAPGYQSYMDGSPFIVPTPATIETDETAYF